MKRFFTYLKTELKLSLRDMNMPIFAVIMPLVIFVILGIIYGAKPAYDGADHTFLEQSFGAAAAIAICAGGLMGLPQAVSGLRTEDPQRLPRHTGQPGIRSGRRAVHVYRLLCRVAGNAGRGGAFVGSAATRLTSCFSWKLGTYHAFNAIYRYAGRRRGEGYQAGQCHCVDPLFPDADLFRRNAAD